jgi:DNA uptake protein ComE-like DNA-binding protein
MALSDWLLSVRQLGNGVKSQFQPLRSKLLNDPYYRFQSIDELRLAAHLGIGIDVNRATVDDWLRLPGLSIHQARSLSSLSQTGVQFHCLEDLAAALSLSVERLNPYEPVLRFCYYDAQSICSIQAIDLNTASIEMLTRIPQVDLFLARAIVQNRQRLGRYRNLTDLQQRLALPGTLVANLMHYLHFGGRG